MSEQYLRGVLGWKGERGFSAYEIAVKNGYIGSEKNWIASLGQTSMFVKDKTVYTSNNEQTIFKMPEEYTSNSIVDVYINGLRLNSKEYSIDTSLMQIVLSNKLDEGAEVEIVVSTMTTNQLPIAIIKDTITQIPIGEEKSLEVDFPSSFTSDNCVIISKMSKLGEFWYDTTNENTDYPIITNIKLGTNIIINMKNISNEIRDGEFRIILMKI